MLTNIITIGNSRGVRIPKPLLIESGIEGKVEMKAKKGKIYLLAVPKASKKNLEARMSEKSLSDWNKKEEDEAWASLQ